MSIFGLPLILFQAGDIDILPDSVSFEHLAYLVYNDETKTNLIDTTGSFSQLLIMFQKSDVDNPAIIASGDPGDWINPTNAVDNDVVTTSAFHGPSAVGDFDLLIDFGSIASRELGIDWDFILNTAVATLTLATSNLEGSGFTTKISHTAAFTKQKEAVAAHSFRYARVRHTFTSGITTETNAYQVYDNNIFGGSVTSKIQTLNEQENVWIDFDTLQTDYRGITSEDFLVVGVPQTASLLRCELVFTGALKTGVQIIKIGNTSSG